MSEPATLEAIWESGIDLDKFFTKFSRPDLVNRAHRLRTRNKKPSPRGIQLLTDSAAKNGDEFAGRIAKAFRDFDLYRDLSERKRNLLNRNSENICELLRSNAFIVTGYRKPSKFDAKPERIPPRFITADATDFQRGVIIVGRIIFESIRVFSIEKTKVSRPEKPFSRPKNKVGRKSIDPVLSAAVADLKSSGKFDGLMQKQQVALVREEVNRRHPGMFASKKPGDTKIRAALKQ